MSSSNIEFQSVLCHASVWYPHLLHASLWFGDSSAPTGINTFIKKWLPPYTFIPVVYVLQEFPEGEWSPYSNNAKIIFGSSSEKVHRPCPHFLMNLFEAPSLTGVPVRNNIWGPYMHERIFAPKMIGCMVPFRFIPNSEDHLVNSKHSDPSDPTIWDYFTVKAPIS